MKIKAVSHGQSLVRLFENFTGVPRILDRFLEFGQGKSESFRNIHFRWCASGFRILYNIFAISREHIELQGYLVLRAILEIFAKNLQKSDNIFACNQVHRYLECVNDCKCATFLLSKLNESTYLHKTGSCTS